MLHGTRLRTLSILTVVFLIGGFSLAAFWAPLQSQEGLRWNIFYLHVPMAIVALCGFVAGGWFGIQYLRKGDSRDDLRSYVAIHISVVLGVGVLVTGAIWARSAWGKWFLWDEPVLVSFLIIFLLYCTYTPLRFSIPESDRQARYASVFAIIAGAFVPINFTVVRMAQQDTHPRSLTSDNGFPIEVWLTFLTCLLGMTLLYVTLWRYEMASKNTTAQLRALRRKLDPDDQSLQRRSAAPTLEA